jgi:cyanophycinase
MSKRLRKAERSSWEGEPTRTLRLKSKSNGPTAETSWVRSVIRAFQTFGSRRHVVAVLRESGDDAYNSYIQGLGKLNSVATLITKNRVAATDSFVLEKIDQAEAIFFAGGDQSVYLQEWMDTPLQKHIQAAIARGVPVGGTSAGGDVQGGFIYTAINDSVLSKEALADPFNFRVTLQERSLINHTTPTPILVNVLVDTHFITRDRIGRLMTFLARLWQDGHHAIGIGIDEQTAFAIDRNGSATLLRQAEDGGRAFILTPSQGPETCEPKKPLEFSDVQVLKLDAAFGDKFDFVSMEGGDKSQIYKLSAKDGELDSKTPYSPPRTESSRRAR